jgi:hypothetical protein
MHLWLWLLAPVVSALAIMVLLVALPASFLDSHHFDRAVRRRHRIEGACLIIAGVVLAIPGVPGPGVALVVLGLLLLATPERGIAVAERHKRIVGPINRLRALFRRPPLWPHHP